jgi:hypothetical protein
MAQIKGEFHRLVAEWKASHGARSTHKTMTEHPSYRAIIALGEPAVPFILEELARYPDWWFSALKAITGANPIHPDDRGNLGKMAAAWIQWGRSHGYDFVSESCEWVPEVNHDSASHHQPL